jgi:hypothetical protein
MTDITAEKRRLLELYAKNYCGYDRPASCMKDSCSCAIAAEYRAFINRTIPDGFRQFSIRDFHGKVNEATRLPLQVARAAKEQVFKYCWGDLSLLERLSLLSEEELNQASIIADRISRGHNVVIHGTSPKRIEKLLEGNSSVHETPIGRTFIASVITKEAIKLKLDPKFRSLSFEWIQFNPLLQSIKNDGNDAIHYESCGWLVVDDITESMLKASLAQKAFTETLLDSFFSHRVRQKHPTVLVFKFDIDARRTEIESAFGVTINKIINDRNTCVISLSDLAPSADAREE